MKARPPQSSSESTGCNRRPPPAARSHRYLEMTLLLLGALMTPCFTQERTGRRGRGASLRTAGLIAIQKQLSARDPQRSSLETIQQHAGLSTASAGARTLAFEENPHFVYALMAVDGQRRRAGREASVADGPRRWRRVCLLKPSTLVVEDFRRGGRGRAGRWRLLTSTEPSIEGSHMRFKEDDDVVLGETLLPESAALRKNSDGDGDAQGRSSDARWVEVRAEPEAGGTRFLHVFHIRAASGEKSTARSELTRRDGGPVELTVATGERVFRLTLPADAREAGELEVAEAEGKVLLPRRLLPSSIMPHGPEGSRLLERWDAPYRRDRAPGWDVGRPSSHLVQAVKDGKLPTGRAIVFGCGTGTNAIYLARQGFEVTGVDVAPSALNIAREKAKQAGVDVRWMVADVVSLPAMQPFDLIFDRGCYHHVRQYDAAGYVQATRRLLKPGGQILLLAGSDKQTGGGGPPRIKEEEIRADFKDLYDFQWFRAIRFDRAGGEGQGAHAWSVLMRRKS